MKELKKIPVVIITGFLGAGKTTFINNIIHWHKHLKLALIENEFGETSIDTELIVGIRGENIFELSNGCICCTINNEFTLAMVELAKKLNDTDYILIETSGVADLSQIVNPFYSDKQLLDYFELAGSVCIADAVNYHQLIKNDTQQKQIIHSDLVLLNKSDDKSNDELELIEKSIKAYNSSAQIIRTNYSKLNSFELNTFKESTNNFLEKRLKEPPRFRLVENTNFKTFTHQFKGRIRLDKFKYWFDYFASINQLEIYRIKGILYTEESDNKTIVQSVGGATSYSEGSYSSITEEPVNTLVFIGNHIDFERITSELERYLFEN